MKKAEDMVVNAELQKRIVEAAKSLFLEKGIRAVTMDEVSRYLRISKRTLYQIIRDKEELILLYYEAETREQTRRIESEIASGNDIMTIIIHQLDYMLQVADHISMSTIKDLWRFPRLQEAARQRRMMLEERFVNFFALGVEQGMFEADVAFPLYQFRQRPHEPDGNLPLLFATRSFPKHRIDASSRMCYYCRPRAT